MKPCNWTSVTGTNFPFPGKQNAGSSFPADTIFHIRLCVFNGHNVEPGIYDTGNCCTLAPNLFVLLHLIFTSKPLCLTSTSPRTNCLVLSNATLPVTTSWDLRDKVNNPNNTISHFFLLKTHLINPNPCLLWALCLVLMGTPVWVYVGLSVPAPSLWV